MTNEYDFILDNMRFSYSSANSFDTCPHGFFLTYIDAEDRIQNFFSQFGLYVHDILEKWFNNELDLFELPMYYEDHYEENITLSPPPYPKGMAQSYYDDGLNFFENISFDKEKYELISTEDAISYEYNDIKLIIKPDLILKDKESGEMILFDYKTSKLGKNKKKNQEKIDGYLVQFYLYVVFLWIAKDIEINKILVWFVRNQDIMEFAVDPYKAQEAVEWFESTITKIKNETEWKANLDKKNDYFCRFICSTFSECQPKQDQIAKEWAEKQAKE